MEEDWYVRYLCRELVNFPKWEEHASLLVKVSHEEDILGPDEDVDPKASG